MTFHARDSLPTWVKHFKDMSFDTRLKLQALIQDPKQWTSTTGVLRAREKSAQLKDLYAEFYTYD